MHTRSCTAAALCACLLAPVALAQTEQCVKGSGRDLAGAATVYVDAGLDRELRDALVAQLRAELPEVTVVDAPAQAALIVRFSRSLAPARAAPSGVRHDAESNRVRSQINPSYVPLPRGSVPRRRGRYDPPLQAAPPETESSSIFGSPRQDPRTDRWAFATVLKPAGANRYIEAIRFKQVIWTSYQIPVRDFVRKLAKEYRKANQR